MIFDIFARSRTEKIEIRMVGGIDYRILIACAVIVKFDLIVIGKCICDRENFVSGESHIHVGRIESELNAVLTFFGSFPYTFVNAVENIAVKIIFSVIYLKIVFLSVYFKACSRNSVCTGSYNGTEERSSAVMTAEML